MSDEEAGILIAAQTAAMQMPVSMQGDFDGLTDRYTGATALHYDARRTGTLKWQTEQAIVERLLGTLPEGASVVDIPVGTGRFLPLYRKLGLAATGMDVSADMLARAREKGTGLPLRLSDIRHIAASDGEYDCALCIRFLNWVDDDGLRAAVRELARVSRQHVIAGVRSYAPLSRLTLRRRIRQQWARWQPRAAGALVVHDHAVVLDAFRQAHLAVESTSLIERSPDGTDYEVFHLRR